MPEICYLNVLSGSCLDLQVRVAIIGNVDSGKSTMVGVMTRMVLDDGRGFARSRVFKHSHEEATGRTSSIGQHNLVVGKLYFSAAFVFTGFDPLVLCASNSTYSGYQPQPCAVICVAAG